MSTHLQLILRGTAIWLLCAFPSAFAQEDEEDAPPPQQKEPAGEMATSTGSERPSPTFQSDAEVVDSPDASGAGAATPDPAGGAPRAGESASLRDPFWPIGYAPVVPGIPQKKTAAAAAPPKVVEPPKWDEALKSLRVDGIMKTASGAYVAVVNGQVASEQEVISKSFSGKTYSWKISSISKAGIKFAREAVSQ